MHEGGNDPKFFQKQKALGVGLGTAHQNWMYPLLVQRQGHRPREVSLVIEYWYWLRQHHVGVTAQLTSLDWW